MPLEMFANLASTTVAASKTAPASGTVETWVVASSASFPAVSAANNTVFRIVEDDPTKQSEIILVTEVTGTSWTVTRGAESTTPVTHPAGFTVVQVVTDATFENFVQTDGGQTIAGIKTWIAQAGFQHALGTNPVSIRARLTANGGQSGDLLEFRDAGNSKWTSFDSSGTFTSLLTATMQAVVAGTGLGTAGQVIAAKATAATSGVPTQDSGTVKWRSGYWNGSASVDEDAVLTGVRFSSTVGDMVLQSDHALSLKDITVIPGTLTGQVSIYSSSGRGKVKDGLGNVWNLDSSQLFRTTATTANSTTTLADVTGLSCALPASGSYVFECNGLYNTAATSTGCRLSIAYTGTQSAFNLGAMIATAAATTINGSLTTPGNQTGSTTVSAGATLLPFQIFGSIVTTASGNLKLQVASGVAASTVTIQIGTYMRVTRVL